MNFVLVAVLEGTACYCWYVVGLGAVATRRAAVVDGRNTTVLESQPAVMMPEPRQDGRDSQGATQAALVELQPVASNRNSTVSRLEVVASMPKVMPAGRVEQYSTHAATVAEGELVASDACADPITPNDDRWIAQIHEAVAAGRLKRNLLSIRKFLGCSQSEASRLNRLYIERFGKARGLRVVPMS